MSDFDATVVGAGPNGLAAALELARSGRNVLVLEGTDRIGGGARTEELTLPGFKHDVCSAIHPSGIASPFLRHIGLEVDWVDPPIPVSHPIGDGRAAVLYRSVEGTANMLGDDGDRYRRVMQPMVDRIEDLVAMLFGPVLPIPLHPGPMARATLQGGPPASLRGRMFRTPEARALYAGLAAHSIAPFSGLATSGVGLVLGAIGHAMGWPMARGGSQAIADAMAGRLEELGVSIETGRMVDSANELPGNLAILDVMPPAAIRIAGARLHPGARRRLGRWRPGTAVFKVDWALDGPVPWADPHSSQAGTVHIGGTFEEIEAAERTVFRGGHPERPFVLVAQQSLFDDSRAPEGKHTLWGYCHVPSGSTVDMTEAIESQIERFAPGFRDRIIGRSTMHSLQYEAYNPNLIGGDIGGGRFGVGKVLQIGADRPYTLGGGLYLCSSATPPGAGVHGMCGYNAARAALRQADTV
jgi:phytoene dehydrogenase-like protein